MIDTFFLNFIRHNSERAEYRGFEGTSISDPAYKDGNDRFTTVPLKALSDQV